MHVAGEFALSKMAASASSNLPSGPHRERAVLRHFKAEQGSNLVEYAIMLLAFMMMIFGIVAAGEALYAYHFVSHASREATRWAAVNGADCTLDSSCPSGVAAQSDVQTYVNNIIPAGIDSTQVNVSANWPPTSGLPPGVTDPCAGSSKVPGCPVQVTVSYVFHFPVALFPTTGYTLSSTSQMIIAH